MRHARITVCLLVDIEFPANPLEHFTNRSDAPFKRAFPILTFVAENFAVSARIGKIVPGANNRSLRERWSGQNHSEPGTGASFLATGAESGGGNVSSALRTGPFHFTGGALYSISGCRAKPFRGPSGSEGADRRTSQ